MTSNHSTQKQGASNQQSPNIKRPADQAKAPAPDNIAESAQQMAQAPKSVGSTQVMGLQRALGNQAVRRMIQPELTVGAADDTYEQEADQVAERVMKAPEPATGPPGPPNRQHPKETLCRKHPSWIQSLHFSQKTNGPSRQWKTNPY